MPQREQFHALLLRVVKWLPAPRRKLSVKRVVEYLNDYSLCVVLADNKGGFCVFLSGGFCPKASNVIAKFLKHHDDVSLREADSTAIKLCKKSSLGNKKEKGTMLVQYSAETHKGDVVLRIIASDYDAWLNQVALVFRGQASIFFN